MHLILGGKYQGKIQIAKQLLFKLKPELCNTDNMLLIEDFINDHNENVFDKPIWYHFEECIKKWEYQQCNIEQKLEALINEYPEAIIVINEVGSGIISMDQFEREWREQCGRAACYLAKEAESVVRVICGIPVELKGVNTVEI